MVRIAGQQAEHFSFAQAWVSERECILPAFNFPMSKLAAFEEEFKAMGCDGCRIGPALCIVNPVSL